MVRKFGSVVNRDSPSSMQETESEEEEEEERKRLGLFESQF